MSGFFISFVGLFLAGRDGSPSRPLQDRAALPRKMSGTSAMCPYRPVQFSSECEFKVLEFQAGLRCVVPLHFAVTTSLAMEPTNPPTVIRSSCPLSFVSARNDFSTVSPSTDNVILPPSTLAVTVLH